MQNGYPTSFQKPHQAPIMRKLSNRYGCARRSFVTGARLFSTIGNVRDNWRYKGPVHKHHNLIQLERSAVTGCPVCELFLDSFRPGKVDSIRQLAPFDESSLCIISFKGWYLISMCFHIPDKPNVHNSIIVKLAGMHPQQCLFSGTNSLNADSNSDAYVGTMGFQTDCDSSWKLAHKWPSDCLQSHHVFKD